MGTDKYAAGKRRWALANPEKRKASQRRWNAANRDKLTAIRRKYVYGITSIGFNALLIEQKGACGVCNRKEPTKLGWHVDHDHTTGKVRGVLCSNCNTAIGLMKDNPLIADSAAVYLRKHQDDK